MSNIKIIKSDEVNFENCCSVLGHLSASSQNVHNNFAPVMDRVYFL